MPDIFQYTDYRDYLKARYDAEKRKNPAFSYRYFSRMAGYSSSSFLKMVIDGHRKLTVTAIHKFVKVLKLGVREADYFETMVFYNQAAEGGERDTYYDRLCALSPKAKLKGIEKDQYEFFTQRHFVFIREMVALSGFREDAVWIARHIVPPITPDKALHAIEVLLRLNFLERDEAGNLRQSDGTLTTPVEVESAALYHLQRSMLDLAKESIRTTPKELRDITSLTIPLPKKAIPEAKRKLLLFKESFADWVNKQGGEYHEVFQINMQFFPVTDTKNPRPK